jgi:hypothetical protein
MANRREFIKKATLSSVAVVGLSGLTNVGRAASLLTGDGDSRAAAPGKATSRVVLTGWEISFDETTTTLRLANGPVQISGRLSFASDNEAWTIGKSRDGVPDRYALINPQGNVQGYFVLMPAATCLRLLFYHRTAQAYHGVLTYEGTVSFPADSFACRTQPKAGERVLPLRCGAADSLWNDSLFSPENDLVLQMKAAERHIGTVGGGRYSFRLSGRIEEADEAEFTLNIEPDYFRRRYVPYYAVIDRQRCPKAPTGWMSWNTYFDKATAEDNLAEAKIGQKYLLPFGCEFWSIESWQGNSDQLPVCDFYNMDLEVNEKQFPKGMKQLADDIRALGFRPGLWVPPFGTGNAAFYKAHRNWFLHDPSGQPIRSWNGQYTLDPTVEEARTHLKGIFHKASREWGYEFFKIDGMSGRNHGLCAHLYERPEIRACFNDPACPNPFELCVQAFREGIGDDRVFLACQGHTSGPETAYADAARIGADIVHPDQPVHWSNVLNQGSCLVNQVFTHNIVMIADPDTLLVHDLSPEEARTSATIVALPGQLTFFGDKLAALSPEQMKILQQTLPVADVLPVHLYPHFHLLPVWNLAVHHDTLGDYNVVALFNWNDSEQPVSVTAEELGIDAGGDYTAFEFWTARAVPYEKASQSLSMDVPAHGVRIVVVHPLQSVPQWVGSDRHIAQNGLEITDYAWHPERRSLEGTVRLIGTFPLTMYLNVPKGYTYRSMKCSGARYTMKEKSPGLLSVTLLADRTTAAKFEIHFG